MTYSKVHRLIICDVTPHIVLESKMKELLADKLRLSRLNISYNRNEDLSLFIDYCPETRHLEIIGTRNNFDTVGDSTISFKHKIEPSSQHSSEYIAKWVRSMDQYYSSPKTESYGVF